MDIESRKSELNKLNRQGLSALSGIREQQIKSSYSLLLAVDRNLADDIYKTEYLGTNDLEIRLHSVATNKAHLPLYTSDYIINMILAAEIKIGKLNDALQSYEAPESHLKSNDRKRSPTVRLSDDDWEEIEAICAEQQIHIGLYFRELALKDLEGRRNP